MGLGEITHLLPYGHLLHAELRFNKAKDGGAEETLTLNFAAHTVSISGAGLIIIVQDLQKMTLAEISQKSSGGNVKQIEVHERNHS